MPNIGADAGSKVTPIAFLGGSLDDLREFPAAARREAGCQLDRVQRGLHPDDWRPMQSIGTGVRETRVGRDGGRLPGDLCGGVRRCDLCAARISEEDASDRKTGCRFGRGAAAGFDREEAMTEQVFVSVWDALEDSPTEAKNMKLRSSLMIAISEAVTGWHLPQGEAARRLGVTQPCLSDISRGRVDKFDLDTLVALAARAGLAVRLEITMAA
jgi:predicted XRE-type DNA-binding protein